MRARKHKTVPMKIVEKSSCHINRIDKSGKDAPTKKYLE
jgi:hypothetical protein